jgi:hypothetical protein
MATVVKNFRIKSGLIVEGNTGTIGGQNILTETGGDSYILNLVGGATLVKSVDTGVFSVDGSGNLTVNANTFDSYGSASAAEAAAISAAATDASTKASNAQSAAITAAATDATTKVAAEAALRVSGDAASVSTAAADATSKANAAQAAAESTASADATSKANAAQSAAISAAATDATTKANAAQSAAISAAATDATTKANAAQAAAIASAATDATTKANAAQAAAEQHADDAVAALVNGAPAVLDTLNELAEALQDNPDIISDLQGIAAGKQDTLTAGANIDITGSTISVTGLDSADISDFNTAALSATSAAYDAAGSASAAQTAAQSYADGLAVNYDAAGSASAAQTAAQSYADGLAVNYDAAGSASAAQTAAETHAGELVDDLTAGITAFTEINVNSEAKQIAATSSSLGSVVVTAYQWAKADFRSGKFLVKIDNGTHNEISEILVTLDSSDNVAITEYAIVGTNGSRGTITASVSGANVQLRVDPVNDSTIKVSGTLLK